MPIKVSPIYLECEQLLCDVRVGITMGKDYRGNKKEVAMISGWKFDKHYGLMCPNCLKGKI